MEDEKDPVCPDCGKPKSEHEVDQFTGRQTKCPVIREESHTPPQERARSPRADY